MSSPSFPVQRLPLLFELVPGHPARDIIRIRHPQCRLEQDAHVAGGPLEVPLRVNRVADLMVVPQSKLGGIEAERVDVVLSRLEVQCGDAGLGVLMSIPIAAASRVIPYDCGESTLKFATICLSGSGGFATKRLLPSRPPSSAVTDTNMIDRLGSAWANASAAAKIAATPRALSWAPLKILSSVGASGFMPR